MLHMLFSITVLACSVTAAALPNLSITSDPYLTGGLFTKPLLPHEGQETVITIRGTLSGSDASKKPQARIVVMGTGDRPVAEQVVTLDCRDGKAEGCWSWTPERNGLYQVRVELDPAKEVKESNEQDNAAELLLPVIVKGKCRDLHFPWYAELPSARWATCVTSSRHENQARLAERGVLPLNWEYGGMSWTYYDAEKARTQPQEVLAEFEELFYKKYSSPADVYGFGIDECGGYPGAFSLNASVASMKGLIRARREKPDRFYAVWHGGGMRPELAAVYRQAADLLLLETYVWRALPQELGCEDIYQAIVSRVDPFIRANDMFQPAYGNHCYTLIALDASERPDRIDLGEQEQVVRFIRRHFPEMRGIAWYNSGYGNKAYGVVRSADADRHHEAVLANADRLCFEYFIKPCVTLMPESLWVSADDAELVAAVSNIGGIDAGPVTVEFLVDGESVGVRTTDRVPAGANRNEDRVLLKQPLTSAPGPHRFEARITAAAGATVLDAMATAERFVGR